MSKRDFGCFIAGIIVGSFGAWYYTKKKYEKIAQDEINSVKEVFSKQTQDAQTISAGDMGMAHKEKEKSDILEYTERLKAADYIDYSASGEKAEKGIFKESKPYVISPDEFGEADGYETISLTYYSDGVLADQSDELVEDVDGTVGIESLNRFGEYEDDSVFVRNERLKEDFEILLDQRNYAEIVKQRPHRREDE